ncbi:hypothetical protein [Flavobacterium sp. AG291]|uniref:hypothetical protein n=1 Tax=Flavobacterium sp. AG291 TaxID=2184000 RepID=UPI000E2C9D9F|nr:hypothetical protein [Flavobacterium sp. AG291]RDI11250.1 hypothetical protein DEU42_106184 [Flavobacterium sp. AG291]
MTYKEKLDELDRVINQKLTIYNEIQEDLESESVFKKYNIVDYENAMDAHTLAVNNRGNVSKEMIRLGLSLNDDYVG